MELCMSGAWVRGNASAGLRRIQKALGTVWWMFHGMIGAMPTVANSSWSC